MIRVIIEREVAEGLEQYYEDAIGDLLNSLQAEPGYLSGESLVELHRPNRYLVVTRWSSEDSWNRWFHSAQRQELLGKIRPFLLTEEKTTMLRQLKYQTVTAGRRKDD